MSVPSFATLARGAVATAVFGLALASGLQTASFEGVATVASAQALDRRVNVINRTGVTIREFYASSVGQNTWEEDILGSGVLASGSSATVNIDDGTGYCMYDLKAVFEDDDEVVKYRVNVCEVSSVTFS